jgi:DNA repair protein RadC
MITLKSFEHTPSLAELKVSYRRGKSRDGRQTAMPFHVARPVDCETYLRSVWDKDRMELQEEFVVVCLNNAHEVLGWVRVATGGMDRVNIDPRIIFGVALQTASAAIVVAHNHPGGKCDPSAEDRQVTRDLMRAGELIGVKVLDHLIITRDNCYSFAAGSTLR